MFFIGLALVCFVNFILSFRMFQKQQIIFPERNILGNTVGQYLVDGDDAKHIAKQQMFGYGLIFVTTTVVGYVGQGRVEVLCLSSPILIIGLYAILQGFWRIYKSDKEVASEQIISA